MLVKFIREWKGHQPGTYNYVGKADILMREGIAEPAHEGELPHIPHNCVELPTREKCYS